MTQAHLPQTPFVPAPDAEMPFVSEMRGRWYSARTKAWIDAVFPDVPESHRPSEALLSRLLDDRPVRFQEVSVAEDMTKLRVMIETGGRLRLPGVAYRAAEELLAALAPRLVDPSRGVRGVVKEALRTLREPLDLIAFSARGDEVVETKAYWRGVACDESLSSGVFTCLPTDEASARSAMDLVSDFLGAERVAPEIVVRSYAEGGILDGFGFDFGRDGASAMKPYFTSTRDAGAALAGVALDWAGRPDAVRIHDALAELFEHRPSMQVDNVATERTAHGGEAKIYCSLLRLDSAETALSGALDVLEIMERADMGSTVAALIGRLTQYGGRVHGLGFDVPASGRPEVKVYAWPAFSYDPLQAAGAPVISAKASVVFAHPHKLVP